MTADNTNYIGMVYEKLSFYKSSKQDVEKKSEA